MNCQEFSDEFDTLLNSYAHTIQFGNESSIDINLTEYEKSVFLTKAQEDIIKELYSGSVTGVSFESSERLRRELQSLVCQKLYDNKNGLTECKEDEEDNKYINDNYRHTLCSLPPDILYIIYEQVKQKYSDNCNSKFTSDVYPTTHDEYWRIKNNPFKKPNQRRVLRLDKGNNQVELISKYDLNTYILRYIKQPKDINLDKPDDSGNVCDLDETLHRTILERAVRLALISRNINIKDNSNQ